MGKKAAEEHAPASWKWNCGHFEAGMMETLHIGVADLPVTTEKMILGAFFVSLVEDVHATVFHRGIVKGNPDANDGGEWINIKVGAILVPWLFAAYFGRFA